MYDINASPRSGYHLPRPHSQQQQQQQPQQQQHHHRFSPSESAQSMRFAGSSGSPYYPPSTPPSNMMAVMGNPAAYPESRVYGRTKDLRKLADFRTPAPPTTPTTATASSSSSSRDHLAASTPSPQEGPSSFGFSLGSKTGRPEPVFSVEVYANAFDERGYPIYAGKAANLAANVRLHPSLNADIQVTTYAYTTAGASAAVWDGVVLLPSASQTDRTIFKVKDRFETNQGQLSVRSPIVGPPGPSSSPSPSASSRPSPVQEDYVLTVPLRWNLPIGASRAIVDGQSQTVHVSLPPSFEVTRADERDQQQMEAHAAAIGLSSSSSGSSLAPSSIYHGSPPGSSAGTTIGAPTITTLTPKKSKARTVRGMVERSLESVTRLGCFYAMDFALIARDSSSSSSSTTTAATPPSKSEKSEKSSKKGSDKNGVAKERIIDVITIPFIFAGEASTAPLPAQALPLTLRPQLLFSSDAILAQDWQKQVVSTKWTGMMLKALRRGIQMELHLPAAPAFHAPSVIPFLIIIRPSDVSLLPPAPTTPPEQDWQSQIGSSSGRSGILRRPNTAPTVVSNASSPNGSSITRSTSRTTTTTNGGSGTVDLARVVMVSLVQVVYSTTPNVNDLPVRKRQIMSVAQEVEEVDLGAFLSEDASTSDEKVIREAQAAGVRVLAGKLRVSPGVTPSFRSQGIEVKYAVKIDLVPFAGSGSSSSSNSNGGGGGGGGSGASSSARSIKEGVSSSGSSPVGTSLSSAMRSLGLKSSSSRFEGSYAGSIFSGKSRRARGFSDGSSTVDQDWDATASMPAGSPQAGLLSSSFSTRGAEPRPAPRGGGGGVGSIAGGSYGGASSTSSPTTTAATLEWEADYRSRISRLSKTAGALWVDIRIVRGADALP